MTYKFMTITNSMYRGAECGLSSFREHYEPHTPNTTSYIPKPAIPERLMRRCCDLLHKDWSVYCCGTHNTNQLLSCFLW